MSILTPSEMSTLACIVALGLIVYLVVIISSTFRRKS